MKVTNTQPGPRGINTVNGPVLIEPSETADVEVFEREKGHIEASGWFTIDGDYTADEKASVTVDLKGAANDASAEIADLKRQLAEKDAELAKVKADKGAPTERDELKTQADELKLDYPGNISNAKLKELIDAKLAS